MSDIEKIVEFSQSVPNAVNTVYEDALQPSVKVVGTSLASVLEFLTIPVKGMQYVSDRAKLNLQHHLQTYSERLNAVDKKNRCEVHPELGVPILQRLTYTTNAEIADLFTNLLLSASDTSSVANAHPAFITMIDAMVPDEARIIQYIGESNFILYCEVNYICKRKKMEDLSFVDLSTSFVTVRKWATNIPSNVQLDFPENCNFYLTNLMSLGIIVDKRGYSKTNLDEQYEEIIAMNKLRDLEDAMDKDKYEELQIENSFFEVTDLGKRFIKACCKK